MMEPTELEEFLRRYDYGSVDDSEFAEFIELHLINSQERQEFQKRKISIAGCFCGRYDATDSNEKFLDKCFRRWNALVSHKLFPGV